MHTINIEQISPSGNGFTPHKKLGFSLLTSRFVLFSVFGHSLVIAIVLAKFSFTGVDKHALNNEVVAQTPRIKSYLYISLPEPIQKEQTQEQEQPPATIKLDEHVKDINIANEIINELTSKQVASNNNEPLVAEVPEQINANAKNQITIDETNQETVNALQSFSNYGSRDAIQRQLQSIETNKLNELAQSASRQYANSLISPEINAPVYTNEHLYSKESGVHMITCDDSIKTKLKILSGLMGGKIKCREKDFQVYIDGFLKKTPD